MSRSPRRCRSPRRRPTARTATSTGAQRCDTEIGKLALPLFPQQDCFAPFSGDNGGATSTGVTADTIKVVVYLPQENDPVLKFIYAQIDNDDTPDDTWATYQKYNEMFSHYYETYGRKVELVRFDATGNIQRRGRGHGRRRDDRQRHPAVHGAGRAAAHQRVRRHARRQRGHVRRRARPASPTSGTIERAPYVWDIAKNAEQNQQMVAEYIGKRLAGDHAVHAGGAGVAGQATGVRLRPHQRLRQRPGRCEDEFTANLKDDYGVEFATDRDVRVAHRAVRAPAAT